MAAADSLIDLDIEKTSDPETSKSKWKGKNKKKDEKVSDHKEEGDVGKEKSKVEEQQDTGKEKFACFICSGPHRARDCPKKENLSAVTVGGAANAEWDSDSDGPERVNPIQLLNTIQVEKATSMSGLLYINVLVNDANVVAIVDTGATHSFVASRVAENFKLRVDKSESRIKVVNSAIQQVQGLARSVQVRVGTWGGQLDLIVMPLDEFDLILGNDFLVASKAALVLQHGRFSVLLRGDNFEEVCTVTLPTRTLGPFGGGGLLDP